MMRRISLLPSCAWLGLVLALGLAGCGGETAPEQEVVRPVKAITFGGAGSGRLLTYPGRVYPNKTVEVSFEVAGKILELPVAKGQEVEVGELLAKLDQRDFQNELTAARALAQEAQATRQRYEEAARTRAVSQREVDEARARARALAADVRIAEKALEDSEIRANMRGVVADRYVDAFQRVEAKEPILSLQDISTLEVRVDVPERDIGGEIPEEDEIGRLSARFDTLPDREFELAIKEIVTDADPVTQTFRVTLSMPNPPKLEILPGMSSTVTWEPPAAILAGGNTVPAAAVLGVPPREAFVWVIDQQSMTVSRRAVTLGQVLHHDQVQVLSGLEPGEVIAAAGAHHLSEGMQVRVLDGAQAGPRS